MHYELFKSEPPDSPDRRSAPTDEPVADTERSSATATASIARLCAPASASVRATNLLPVAAQTTLHSGRTRSQDAPRRLAADCTQRPLQNRRGVRHRLSALDSGRRMIRRSRRASLLVVVVRQLTCRSASATNRSLESAKRTAVREHRPRSRRRRRRRKTQTPLSGASGSRLALRFVATAAWLRRPVRALMIVVPCARSVAAASSD